MNKVLMKALEIFLYVLGCAVGTYIAITVFK